MFTEQQAELIEIGGLKLSENWSNIYLKFKFKNGKELWLYYSEHKDKPQRLKQIADFVEPIKFSIGSTMTVNYELVQSPNKSNKLAIRSLSNCKRPD
jgi:hypothetical protein